MSSFLMTSLQVAGGILLLGATAFGVVAISKRQKGTERAQGNQNQGVPQPEEPSSPKEKSTGDKIGTALDNIRKAQDAVSKLLTIVQAVTGVIEAIARVFRPQGSQPGTFVPGYGWQPNIITATPEVTAYYEELYRRQAPPQPQPTMMAQPQAPMYQPQPSGFQPNPYLQQQGGGYMQQGRDFGDPRTLPDGCGFDESRGPVIPQSCGFSEARPFDLAPSVGMAAGHTNSVVPETEEVDPLLRRYGLRNGGVVLSPEEEEAHRRMSEELNRQTQEEFQRAFSTYGLTPDDIWRAQIGQQPIQHGTQGFLPEYINLDYQISRADLDQMSPNLKELYMTDLVNRYYSGTTVLNPKVVDLCPTRREESTGFIEIRQIDRGNIERHNPSLGIPFGSYNERRLREYLWSEFDKYSDPRYRSSRLISRMKQIGDMKREGALQAMNFPELRSLLQFQPEDWDKTLENYLNGYETSRKTAEELRVELLVLILINLFIIDYNFLDFIEISYEEVLRRIDFLWRKYQDCTIKIQEFVESGIESVDTPTPQLDLSINLFDDH